MDIGGDRSSEEKGVIIPFTKTGQERTRNMTSRTKEGSIDKNIRKINAKRTKQERGWADMIGRPDTGNITVSGPNPFTSSVDYIHGKIEAID